MDASLRLWDLATGQEIRRLEGHMAPVFSVAFTPDGRSGLSGGLIVRYLMGFGKRQRNPSFLGHEGVIWALAVSPDGEPPFLGLTTA